MRIFGVGLSRTGTTSLTAALRSLGYRTTHNRLSLLGRSREGGLQVNMRAVARIDAASGIAIARFYPDLDQAFPGSRFILTTRDTESWVASMQRNRRSQTLVNMIPRYGAMFSEMYGPCGFEDMECMAERFEAHNEAVRAYFANRPGDLLVLDLRENGHWGRLCRFLGCHVLSNDSFPWLNRRYRTSMRNLVDFVLP